MLSWILIGMLKQLKGCSYQDIAKAVGVHRSNLSTYVTTKGVSKNCSQKAANSALAFLGSNPKGVLLPRIHVWSMPHELLTEEELKSFSELLTLNRFIDLRYYLSVDGTAYLVGVSRFGSRLLISLADMSSDDITTVIGAVGALPGYQTDLDAELCELRLQPDRDLFDIVFYWLSQRVVDDFFKKNEVAHV